MDIFLLFLILIFSFAAFANDRFVFAILYLFIGAFVFGRWWSKHAISHVKFERQCETYAFIQEKLKIRLTIINSGWLPAVWLRIHDALPAEITRQGSYQQIISLNPKETLTIEYDIQPRQRGYFPIGPVTYQTGDLLGFGKDYQMNTEVKYLTVFPKVVRLSLGNLPSSSPIGSLRHTQPIFEDPSRPIGKRQYQTGDSLRKIDWKSSASIGQLQVKQYEPSIDLQVFIFLNLNESEYETKFKSSAEELAIVISASITNWTIERKLHTGIFINGLDLGNNKSPCGVIPVNKGRLQLIKILELLARSSMGKMPPIIKVLQDQTGGLGWGTTLILITGQANDTLFDALYRYRQKGINIVLILSGEVSNFARAKVMAHHYGVAIYQFSDEKQLDIWRI